MRRNTGMSLVWLLVLCTPAHAVTVLVGWEWPYPQTPPVWRLLLTPLTGDGAARPAPFSVLPESLCRVATPTFQPGKTWCGRFTLPGAGTYTAVVQTEDSGPSNTLLLVVTAGGDVVVDAGVTEPSPQGPKTGVPPAPTPSPPTGPPPPEALPQLPPPAPDAPPVPKDSVALPAPPFGQDRTPPAPRPASQVPVFRPPPAPPSVVWSLPHRPVHEPWHAPRPGTVAPPAPALQHLRRSQHGSPPSAAPAAQGGRP